jgi:Bifunctional DNA primase/polymerase, N-terminal/DnaB-like helicase C terminal domain
VTTLRQAAIDLAAIGWQVFPCRERAKIPATPNGVKDATDDLRRVGAFWGGDGCTCNVAVATGAGSDVIVLDVDGADGDETLRALQAIWGVLPPTVEARTGRGRHLYFRHPGPDVRIKNSAGKLGSGLDIRSDGGYVVAPPSLHPDGGTYEWVRSPRDYELAHLPEWLLSKLVAKPKPEPEAYQPSTSHYGHTPYGRVALEDECRDLASAPEGTRNDKLNGTAFRVGQLVRGGHLNELMARSEVMSAAKACGLEENEIRQTFASGFKAGQENPSTTDPRPDELHQRRSTDRARPQCDEPPPPSDEHAPAEPEQPAAEPVRHSLTASETAQAALEYLTDEKRARHPRSGFGRLDDCIGGFPPGSHTTIGGTTGSGKSSLALAIALNQCGPKATGGQGHKVGYLSLEDPEWLCGARVLSHLEDVNAEKFFGTAPDPYMVGRAILGVQAARAYGLHFAWAIGKPLPYVLKKIDYLIRVDGCNVVVVDYLQAIAAAGQDNRYAARTDAAQAIKGMCHDRGASLILLSQLKRPEAGSPFKEPTQNALKDSGDIENMSECVILLWPTGDGEDSTTLGKVTKVKWSPRRARFALQRNPKTGALNNLIEPSGNDRPARFPRDDEDWR